MIDTGFEGYSIDSLYGESLSRNPFTWPPVKRVYIDALTEPGLRGELSIGAERRFGERGSKRARAA